MKLLEIVREETEIFSKYQKLFNQFNVLVSYLFSKRPLRTISISQEEWEFLEGPLVLDEEVDPLSSDIEFLEKICKAHEEFYKKNFDKDPIPKHHILVHHISEFALSYGGIGMFAEQGIEACHARGNRFSIKLRTLPKTKYWDRRMKEFMNYSSLKVNGKGKEIILSRSRGIFGKKNGGVKKTYKKGKFEKIIIKL